MRCNKCGAELKPGAKFCTSCGNKNIAQNSFSGGGKICPNCGKEIKDNKKFCTSCGMKLPEPKSSDMADLKIDDSIDINLLYKRAFMYLEDGYKDKALAYFEHFLDRNPEDSTAFYGKLMLDLSFESEEDFKKLDKDIRENKNFKRAYRYGNEALKNKLDEYVHISFGNMLKAARNLDQLERTKEQLIQNGAENIENDFEACRNKILDEMYNDAVARRKRANSPDGMRFAYNSFVEVGDYKDAAKQAEECLETEKQMIKDAETDKIYQDAVKIKDDAASGELPDYEFESSLKKAIATFEQLGEYKDSQKYLNLCNRILSSYKKPVTDAHTEINESSIAGNIVQKPKSILEQIKDLFLKKKIIIISAVVIIGIIITVIIFLVTRPSENQSSNINTSSTAETEASETVPETEAASETTTIVTSQPEESDNEVKYAAANNFILSEKYEDALRIFNELGSYKDSVDKAKECKAFVEKIKTEKKALSFIGKTLGDLKKEYGEPEKNSEMNKGIVSLPNHGMYIYGNIFFMYITGSYVYDSFDINDKTTVCGIKYINNAYLNDNVHVGMTYKELSEYIDFKDSLPESDVMDGKVLARGTLKSENKENEITVQFESKNNNMSHSGTVNDKSIAIMVYNNTVATDYVNEQSEKIKKSAETIDESSVGIVKIDDGYLNVRDLPSTSGKVIGKLQNNEKVKIEDYDGEWFLITSGNIHGYVFAQFIQSAYAD